MLDIFFASLEDVKRDMGRESFFFLSIPSYRSKRRASIFRLEALFSNDFIKTYTNVSL